MFDKFVTKVREGLADKRVGMVVFGVVVLLAVGFLLTAQCGGGDSTADAVDATADGGVTPVALTGAEDGGVSLTLSEAEATYVDGVAEPVTEQPGSEDEATLTLPETSEIQVSPAASTASE